MPKITQIAAAAWPFSTKMLSRLAWHSTALGAFIVGTFGDKALFSINDPTNPQPLVKRADPYEVRHTAYDELLPADVYAELAATGLDGFQFLSREEYGRAFGNEPWGSTSPVDQALISGLTNKLPVRHPGTGSILGFADKKGVSYKLSPQGLEQVAEAKAKSGQALTALLAVADGVYYGTNQGDVMFLPVMAQGFGKQQKVLSFRQPVHSLRTDGARLFVGRLGGVAVVARQDGELRVGAERQTACRSLALVADRWLLLNQGLHGLALLDTAGEKLKSVAEHKLEGDAADILVASSDGVHALALCTDANTLRFLRIDYTS